MSDDGTSLLEVLRGSADGSAADSFLRERRFEEALAAYGVSGPPEKLGWCLGHLERWEDARLQLEPVAASLSSAGLAMLGLARAGGWNRRYQLTTEHRPLVLEALRGALERERPPSAFAYTAFLEFAIGLLDRSDVGRAAAAAVEHYPADGYFWQRLAQFGAAEAVPEKVYGGLRQCLRDTSSHEYRWDCANWALRAKRPMDALELLTSFPDQDFADTRQIIIVARAEAAAAAGDVESAVAQLRALWDDPELMDREIRAGASRALVNVALNGGNEPEARRALGRFLDLVERPGPLGLAELIEGSPMPIRFADGSMGGSFGGRNLGGLREQILAAADEDQRARLVCVFAEWIRERAEDEHRDGVPSYSREEFVAQVLEVDPRMFGGLYDGIYAVAAALAQPPAWRDAGAAWGAYVVERLREGEEIQIYSEPLSLVEKPGAAAVREFAEAMIAGLEADAPPEATEVPWEVLRGLLLEQKDYPLFRRVAKACAACGSPAALFDAGLGAHYVGANAEAEDFYWKVLEQSPTHFSALMNVLMLLDGRKGAERVERVAGLIEKLKSDDSNDRKRLLDELARARARCADPIVAQRAAVRAELARHPGLKPALPTAADLPLRDAVTLLTLVRACGGEYGQQVLEPFESQGEAPFSPTADLRQGLFGLLRAGVIAIDEDETRLEAFRLDEGRVTSYFFQRVAWRTSSATWALIDAIRTTAGRDWWPRAWSEGARDLARELAEGECVQYLWNCAQQRSWPLPDDNEKVRALAGDLIQHASVSEAFYLIYLGAMAASDHLAKYPVNAQQASNVMVLRASQRLDRAKAESSWTLKKYSRTKDVPRSLFSIVLHDEFLRVGEHAFTERIRSLPVPPPRAKASRRSRDPAP